ncbi:hypothetical protein [Carboxydothermus ferrireducens]|uniref:DUF4007 domain-containing protein n=1 Tax=Carboxydothermus ferrireducens DSM 11255 TaxID=1119529 RepID=A0ABX2R8M9_9THEO|nr:hypothetical protein [Carboxydothermus ferrireducens]NYE57524.1 hypothetical protein [Carboxydothermus ferrireducens DSM 11255]
MPDWSEMKGWARHQHFGLRREWLQYYLDHWPDWERGASLGNRQVQALKVWVKTAGLEDRDGRLTPFGQLFRREGVDCLPLWELLWVKVVFNFPTARWYAHLGTGSWTTTELKKLLHSALPHLAGRTISNAVLELAGLCERTPVGRELGQGEVGLEKGKRYLLRRGYEPGEVAAISALVHLFHETGAKELFFTDDLTWPWVVFGCSREAVLKRLLVADQILFEIDEERIYTTGEGEELEQWLNGSTLTTWL